MATSSVGKANNFFAESTLSVLAFLTSLSLLVGVWSELYLHHCSHSQQTHRDIQLTADVDRRAVRLYKHVRVLIVSKRVGTRANMLCRSCKFQRC